MVRFNCLSIGKTKGILGKKVGGIVFTELHLEISRDNFTNSV